MKKIDIENWERKTPKLPENFFDEMQEKVLERTVKLKKQPIKRFKINVIWTSVAASVIVIFGISFFLKFNDKTEKVQTSAIVENKNILNSSNNRGADIQSNIEIKKAENDNPPHTVSSFAGHSPNKVSEQELKKLSTKLKMEDVLNSIDEDELLELVNNYEQDTFLDLY